MASASAWPARAVGVFSRRAGPRVARVSRPSPAPGRAFPRSARLTRRADFDRVFAAGSALRGRYFTVLALPAESRARLGLVVGRRASVRAVTRNRVRRIARELFRQEQLPAFDLVVIARPGLDEVAGARLREDLQGVFDRLKQQCDAS